MSDNDNCDFNFPPPFKFHIIKGNAPQVYTYYLSIGAFFVIIICLNIIPNLRKVRNEATTHANKNSLLIVAEAFRNVQFILLYPLIVGFGNYFVLLSPITEFSMLFATSSFEAFVLVCFARHLILLLGDSKLAVKTISTAEATKFYGAPPLGCCFKRCIKEKKMTKDDLSLFYKLILQKTFISPTLAFISMIRNVSGRNTMVTVLSLLDLISTMVCLYSLGALLEASFVILKKYNSKPKFTCIQITLLGISLPQVIISFTGVGTNKNGNLKDKYTNDVLSGALSSIVTVGILALDSFLFKKYWTVDDAIDALKENENYISRKYTTKDSPLKNINQIEEEDETITIEE